MKLNIIFSTTRKKEKLWAKKKIQLSFKAQVVLAALRSEEPIQSLAKRYEVSPSKITEWM